MTNLKTDIRYLKGIGEKRAEIFYKAGFKNVQDLIYYFPRDWRDFSKISKIIDAKIGQEVTFKVELKQIVLKKTRRRRFSIVEALFSDDTGSVKAVWFNQYYVKNNLKKGDLVLLAGKLEDDFTIKNPVYEKYQNQETRHLGRIAPIYKEVGKISSRMIRYTLKPIIDDLKIKDFMPLEIISSQNLLNLEDAIKNIHFPENGKFLTKAQNRLSFDEIFVPQVLGQIIRHKLKNEKSYPVRVKPDVIEKIYKQLPFKLTSSQKVSLSHIFADLSLHRPMNRLLEGDVGSGKTIVAAIAILAVSKANLQSVLMVPTEVLAWEHYQTLQNFLTIFDEKIEIITGSTAKKEKEVIYKKLANGEIKNIIGTHALLNEKLNFKNLALAVIDEQHRFGVNQRKLLKEKNQEIMPHLLSMTATPIPRTFALTVYGDLDLSILTDMPKGQRKIKTYLVPQQKRNSAYEFIKRHLKKGSKALVICPAISLSEKLQTKAVEEEFEKLSQGPFKNFKIDFLHGKIKTNEKQQKIEAFKNGQIEILISTTVIEVGLNIPNLNVMIIENAERFGLAQLHQLRGRIGRQGQDSFFLIFTDSQNPESLFRLKKMERIKDGFELAEFDLSLRGEGEIFGRRQSGLPVFRLTSFSDIKKIEKARKEAILIVNKDPILANYPKLKKEVVKIYQGVHAE